MNYFCGQLWVTSGVISPARAQKKGAGSLIESRPRLAMRELPKVLEVRRIVARFRENCKGDIRSIGAGAAYLGTKAGFRCAHSFPAPIRSRQYR